MRGQDYRLEPNMIFTPDGKWILFREQFRGRRAPLCSGGGKAALEQ